MTVQQLRDCLSSVPAGQIDDPDEVERVLAECWDQLQGEAGGMKPEKLFGRTEEMTWRPPILAFTIERHGGTVMGSSRARLQEWTINVENGTCGFADNRFRQLGRRQPPLKVQPLADEVYRLIVNHLEHPWLEWYPDGRIRVHTGEIIPDNASKETITGRRKRFWKALDKLMGDGWKRTINVYKPISECDAVNRR